MANVISASAFIDSLGANNQVDFFDTPNSNADAVAKDMQYLGIRYIRTDIPANNAVSWQPYYKLVQAGIKFDFIIPPSSSDLNLEMSNLDAFIQKFPGSIASVEGRNEVNIWTVDYKGESGFPAAHALQQDFYNAVHHDPNLSGIPVYATTLGGGTDQQEVALGNISAFADYGNAHIYPNGGDAPNPNWFPFWFQHQNVPTPGKPEVLTEFGYATTNNPGDSAVDEGSQAKYILDGIFDATKAGMNKTYLYQLIDADTNAGPDVQKHFGLFHSDSSPKPIATAIHNLNTILQDSGGGQRTMVNYDISGLTNPEGSSLLIQKGNGVSDIVVWAEPKIFNGGTILTAPSNNVTVSLGATYGTVEVFDPLKGSTPISTAHNVNSVQISVSDHPVIVQVEPNGSQTATVSSPAQTSSKTTSAAPESTTTSSANGSKPSQILSQHDSTISINNTTITSSNADHSLVLLGSNDTLALTGGINKITENGNHNTFIAPVGGEGLLDITGSIFSNGYKLDLRDVLKATNWNGDQKNLPNYLHVDNANSGADVNVSVAPTGSFSDGSSRVLQLHGVGNTTLNTVLAHSIT